MKYLFLLFMLGCNYYAFTYGVSLWKNEKNKLGSSAVVVLSIIGTLIPAIAVIMKL